jgi:hypothetical protein
MFSTERRLAASEYADPPRNGPPTRLSNSLEAGTIARRGSASSFSDHVAVGRPFHIEAIDRP